MNQTRRPTTRSSAGSSTSRSATNRSLTAQQSEEDEVEKEEEKVEEVVEEIEEIDEVTEEPGPQTLTDTPPKPRGYLNRMLDTVRKNGMEEVRWSGISRFVCTKCKAETFSAAEAKRHKC